MTQSTHYQINTAHPADLTYATAYSSSTEDKSPPPQKTLPAKRLVSGGTGTLAARKAALAIRKKREVRTRSPAFVGAVEWEADRLVCSWRSRRSLILYLWNSEVLNR